jgi:multidrug resistance protein, MATE family
MWNKWKLIILLALPSLASFASITVTGTINLVMVGKLGTTAIAVVGVSNIIMYNAWALFSGLGNSINYLVAQSFGAGEMRKAVGRTSIAFMFCGVAGVLFIGIGLFGTGPILRLMGSSPEFTRVGQPYLQLRFFAMVFSVFSFVIHGFLRGIGNTKTPMIVSLLGNAIMIFFTTALTYGRFGFPELGLRGAGLSIWLGEFVVFVTSAYVYFIRLNKTYHTRDRLQFVKEETQLVLFESGKLGIQEFSMSMAMFIFTAFVTRLGTSALAANEVSLNVMSFGFMPAFAFGSTATILVGQEIGRGNPKLGKSYGTHTAILGALFLFTVGTLELLFAGSIAKLYSSDPAVYSVAALLITISAYLQIFDGCLNFFAGGLRGVGDTYFLLKAALALGWGLFVPLSYLLIFVLDLKSVGAWISLYTYLACFGITVMTRFYKKDWETIQLKTVKVKGNLAG